MDPIRVMIADDHPLLIAGVASVLENQPDMDLVCEASDGREAVMQFQVTLPDVVLMDVQMPQMDGIEATRRIRAACPDARVIILTTYHGDIPALSAFSAGAQGYLLKSMLRTELVAAIRQVCAGRRWIPPQVAHVMAEHVGGESLTRRELQVLHRIAEGCTNKIIAQQLGITADTVKAHVKSILAKLRANDRTHAVTIALRRGFMQLGTAAQAPEGSDPMPWLLATRAAYRLRGGQRP